MDKAFSWTIFLPFTVCFAILDRTPAWFKNSDVLSLAFIVLYLPLAIVLMILGYALCACLLAGVVLVSPFVFVWKFVNRNN